ncbi:MAG: hypothetical protein L0221_08600, partial [Chloroflexi bacterium]|nr:hypothetical protein [Chloroflexota bacterium]
AVVERPVERAEDDRGGEDGEDGEDGGAVEPDGGEEHERDEAAEAAPGGEAAGEADVSEPAVEAEPAPGGEVAGVEAGGEDEDEEKVVFLVIDGKAERRTVDTDIADETHVEITRGLDGGETVVTGPYRTLRDLEDGDPVRVEEPDEDEDGESGVEVEVD